MTPESSHLEQTETRGLDPTEAAPAPTREASVFDPEHKQNDITGAEQLTSPDRTLMDLLRENPRLRRWVGGSALALVLVGGGGAYAGVRLASGEEAQIQPPPIAEAPLVPYPEVPSSTTETSPVEIEPDMTQPLDALPTDLIRYQDKDVPFEGYVPDTETNNEVIMSGLADQLAVAINTGRRDILLATFSTAGSDGLLDFYEQIMDTVQNQYHEGRSLQESPWLFDIQWDLDAAESAGLLGYDPNNPVLSARALTISGEDTMLDRTHTEGIDRPWIPYSATIAVVQESMIDPITGGELGTIWKIRDGTTASDTEELTSTHPLAS